MAFKFDSTSQVTTTSPSSSGGILIDGHFYRFDGNNGFISPLAYQFLRKHSQSNNIPIDIPPFTTMRKSRETDQQGHVHYSSPSLSSDLFSYISSLVKDGSLLYDDSGCLRIPSELEGHTTYNIR